MGCLNSTGQFAHWFGNIHLSGPCNRSCYFCIGQHMMSLDPLDNLGAWPLPGMDEFISRCLARGVKEVNLTGSNTDPMLYRHIPAMEACLSERIKGLRFGVRTNGAAVLSHLPEWRCFDKASISITSFDPDIYRATMGRGSPPDIRAILDASWSSGPRDIKVNIVLCPETVGSGDLFRTLCRLESLGVRRVNLREPYGQPHIGDPVVGLLREDGVALGMARYSLGRMSVLYWDVHYVEVESVNLYANGVVSETYPITKGHDAATGKVEGQEHFATSGRIRPQWVTVTASRTSERRGGVGG